MLSSIGLLVLQEGSRSALPPLHALKLAQRDVMMAIDEDDYDYQAGLHKSTIPPTSYVSHVLAHGVLLWQDGLVKGVQGRWVCGIRRPSIRSY